MMAANPPKLENLCLHTITTRPWTLEEAVTHYASAGVRGISVWREALDGRSPRSAARLIRDSGLFVVSLVRGGFFAAVDKKRPIAGDAPHLRGSGAVSHVEDCSNDDVVA